MELRSGDRVHLPPEEVLYTPLIFAGLNEHTYDPPEIEALVIPTFPVRINFRTDRTHETARLTSYEDLYEMAANRYRIFTIKEYRQEA